MYFTDDMDNNTDFSNSSMELANNTDFWNSSMELDNSTLNVTGRVRPTGTGYRLPPGFYPAIEAAQLLSIVCLCITTFVYRRLPEFRNLPGKNLVTLCVCLILTYAFLFVDFVFGTRWIRHKKPLCLALASLTHTAFLAVFAWTTVLAYDIWHTVTKTTKLANDSSCGKDATNKRYRRYSLYAWISTALVASLPLIQAWGSLDLTPVLPNPLMGRGRCWLNGQKSFLVYFNAPVGVALLANMVFFVMSARTMARIRKMTSVLNVRQHRQRFHLYVKLFLVMGFVWITEFLPLVTGLYILYAVAGFLTCLYGVALFIIFVCKVRVWKALRNTQNLCCCWKSTKKEWNSNLQTTRKKSQTTLTTSLSNIAIESTNSQRVDQNHVTVMPMP